MAQVALEKVSKIYSGNVKAVDAIDLQIADHEFVVLVGPSGCGKTTTLRMIAGLEELSGGVIRIGDRVVNDVPPKDRDIAMVFQSYALYPHMSVYENMEFGLKLRKVAKDEIKKRVMETAKMLEIDGLLLRKPKDLSGGQRQRVALGRAIVREPAAFLLDEPLSNLDASLRLSTRAELKRLHQRLRTTTIYVTHDQEEAMTLGDRIVVMKDGVIQQADTPMQTYHFPKNKFVAGFIGTPPMNFVHGALRMIGEKLIFEEGHVSSKDAAPSQTLPRSAGKGDNTQKNSVDQLTLPGNGFTLCIPERLHSVLSPRVGQHLILGFRPEHLRVKAGDSGLFCPIEIRVSVQEPLGDQMYLYGQTKLSDQLIASVKSEEVSDLSNLQADTIWYVDTRKIHFFEPGRSGLNLCLSTSTLSGPSKEQNHALA